MKTLQIRNVPDETHATLRVRAARAGMSLSDYALEQLERSTSRPPLADVLSRAQARSGGVSRQEIVDAVRAGRDDRG